MSVRKELIYVFCLYRSRIKKAYDVVNVIDQDNTVKTIRTCCRYIKHHLQNANGNLSFQLHKCRNSITGQSSITLQSSSVWIMVTVTAHCCNSKAQLSITGQCLPLKQHDRGMRVDTGGALCYCEWWWVMDRRGWLHTFHIAPCGSSHFHTGTVCLSATDNADTYALPWARRVVSCQPTASWVHICPMYHHRVPGNT